MDHGVQQGVDHGAVIPVASQVCPFQARVANFPVSFAVAFQVKATQSCPTLCDPMDYTVLEILQDRILEWLAVPSPADLPNPGIEPRSPAWQEDSLQAEPQGKVAKTKKKKIQVPSSLYSLCSLSSSYLYSMMTVK